MVIVGEGRICKPVAWMRSAMAPVIAQVHHGLNHLVACEPCGGKMGGPEPVMQAVSHPAVGCMAVQLSSRSV